MLRAGQSLPPKGLSTLRFDAGRFPPTPAACYRASWQLPGPDSHRLADTSLRVDYLNATTSKGVITSRTHAAGHTKLRLGCAPVGDRHGDGVLAGCWSLAGLPDMPDGAVVGGHEDL